MATDYKTECGSLPLTFLQALASCIVGYKDIAGVTHYRINGVLVSDNCSELTDLIDCDTSHIEPDRLLVENTFELDDCSRLAWKIFSNGDNDWTDYGDCGEIPLSFIQMLARTIRTYSGATKINAVIDEDACTEVTALMSCVTNNIEAERLLVNNVFATDDCGNLLIKFFSNTSTMTDYSTACIDMPQTFYQLLSQCIVLYGGHYYINIASVSGYCDDLLDFWTCANNHINPSRALVENIFCTDSCGNMALKLYNNQGEEQQ